MKKFPFKLLVIIPAIILGFLVWKYGVNLPFEDEWDTPGLALLQFHRDQLQWIHLIGQHNESRKFFPRLFFLGLSSLTNWKPKYGMLASFLLSCLISFNIYHLSKITLNTIWSRRLACLAMANLLIFSPMQWANQLWGLQMITFIPIAAITTSLAVIFSSNTLFFKLLISGILATIATFSFANGMITWIIIFPALVFIAKNNKKQLAWVAISWLFWFGLILAIYFSDYHKPAHHPSFTEALYQPIKAIFYYLSFIGSPLGINDLISSQIVGICILFLTALAIFYIFSKNRHNQRLLFNAFPWLSIIFYTLGSGVLTASGRVGLGVEQSLESRYVTFSTYGIVGLIYLLAVVSLDLNSQTNISRNNSKILSKIITVFMVVFLLLYPANFVWGVNQIIATQPKRFYGQACLSLINIVDDAECIRQYVYPISEADPNENHLVKRANELDQLGLLEPALILSDNLQAISRNNFEQLTYGSFDALVPGENNTYIASGWSILPKYSSPSHALILAYQTPDNLDHPFAIAKPELQRADVVEVLGKKQYLNAGWKKTFSQDLIPDDAVAVSAWSYDSEIARAYKLNMTHPIKP